MYLKISDDTIVDKKNIVAILDIRQIPEEISFHIDEIEGYKSIVILNKDGREECIFSCASTQTLLRRADKCHF